MSSTAASQYVARMSKAPSEEDTAIFSKKRGEPADGRLSDEDLIFVAENMAENMDIDEYITYNAAEILREIENEAQRRFKIRYWS